ncbi:MAG: DUF6615 family protein [Nostoc sp.]
MNIEEVRKQLHETAGYIRLWLTKQPNVKEESLTDWLLFNLSNRVPNILYYAFNRHQEGRDTGADWEWWILFSRHNIRFRVQAKKVSSTHDNYPEIARTNRYGLQIDMLLNASKKDNAIPLYALYSSVSGDAMCNNQQIVQNDGIFIAGGQQIYDTFLGHRQKITATDLLKLSNPFSCFACCPFVTADGGGLRHFLEYYFQSEITSSSLDLDSFRGLHDQRPRYLSSFLEYARDGIPEWWENEFQSELQDFNALLVYDFRNYKAFEFNPVFCSNDSRTQKLFDEFISRL